MLAIQPFLVMISSSSTVTYLTGSEGSSVDGEVRVSANGRELGSDIQSDLLVAAGGAGSGVLVLSDGSNLRVHSSLVAENGSLANSGGVPLQSAEHDGVSLAINIASSLGVGESLVGDDLLEAVEVLDVGCTLGSGGVAEQSEDGILDLQRVVELEVGLGGGDDSLVRVLLGNLPLDDGVVEGNLAGSSQAGEGKNGCLELHLCDLMIKRL